MFWRMYLTKLLLAKKLMSVFSSPIHHYVERIAYILLKAYVLNRGDRPNHMVGERVGTSLFFYN